MKQQSHDLLLEKENVKKASHERVFIPVKGLGESFSRLNF